MGRRRGPGLGVTSPQRTASKTDRRFSGFPSQVARKDQKISPVLLSVCTPPFSAKAKVASADATKNQEKGKCHEQYDHPQNRRTKRPLPQINPHHRSGSHQPWQEGHDMRHSTALPRTTTRTRNTISVASITTTIASSGKSTTTTAPVSARAATWEATILPTR